MLCRVRGYDVPDDFAFDALVGDLPYIVSVNPDLPVGSLAELIERAAANPGTVRFGSGGVGSGVHMATILLEQATGAEIVHAPYDGIGPAVTGLIAGEIDLLMAAPSSSRPHVESGAIRAIATTGLDAHLAVQALPAIGAGQ